MVKSDMKNMFDYLHANIQRINESKIFAGLMIITLNIVSKYVNIGLKFHGPECYTSIGVEALVDAIKLNKGSLSNTIYGKYDILDAKLLDLDLNLLQEY